MRLIRWTNANTGKETGFSVRLDALRADIFGPAPKADCLQFMEKHAGNPLPFTFCEIPLNHGKAEVVVEAYTLVEARKLAISRVDTSKRHIVRLFGANLGEAFEAIFPQYVPNSEGKAVQVKYSTTAPRTGNYPTPQEAQAAWLAGKAEAEVILKTAREALRGVTVDDEGNLSVTLNGLTYTMEQ